MTNSPLSLLGWSHVLGVENVWSALLIEGSEFPKCHVLHVLLPFSLINFSPSLFPFHSSLSSPLPPLLTENSSFHLTLCAYLFLSTSSFWIVGSLSLFVPIYSAAKAVQLGHYVVVDPRRVELYSFGGSCHLLSDNRATLQGVQ